MDLNKLFKGTVLEELGQIAPRPPVNEITGNETVVGDMTDLELRVYALTLQYRKMYSFTKIKAEVDSETEQEARALMVEAWHHEQLSKTLQKLMFNLIYRRIPEPEDMVTSIVTGGKIAHSPYNPPNPTSDLAGILKRLRG